jgi:tetratricopeptide (TPR) repeat protein
VKFITACVFELICALAAVPPVFAQASFKEELDLGVLTYKEAKYEEASRHFQNATAIQPQNEIAHLYLATAYAQQYIPGVDLPENAHLGEMAVSEYQKVLEINSKSQNSLKGLAYLSLQMKKFDDAKAFYRRTIDEDPNDPETYYSIGVIDWTVAYTPRMKLREKLALKPDEPMPIDAPGCWELRDSNLDVINEGVNMMAKALELRHDYEDAMAYMNLLYRERAEIQCNDAESHASDLAKADHWVDLTMETKNRKIEKARSNNKRSVTRQ